MAAHPLRGQVVCAEHGQRRCAVHAQVRASSAAARVRQVAHVRAAAQVRHRGRAHAEVAATWPARLRARLLGRAAALWRGRQRQVHRRRRKHLRAHNRASAPAPWRKHVLEAAAHLAALLSRRVFAANPAHAQRDVAHALVRQRCGNLDVPRQRAHLVRCVALQQRLRERAHRKGRSEARARERGFAARLLRCLSLDGGAHLQDCLLLCAPLHLVQARAVDSARAALLLRAGGARESCQKASGRAGSARATRRDLRREQPRERAHHARAGVWEGWAAVLVRSARVRAQSSQRGATAPRARHAAAHAADARRRPGAHNAAARGAAPGRRLRRARREQHKAATGTCAAAAFPPSSAPA